MPQRPVINPPPVSEMFFGPDGTEKSVFDSFPKRIAKSVTELLGLDAPPDPSDFVNPLGVIPYGAKLAKNATMQGLRLAKGNIDDVVKELLANKQFRGFHGTNAPGPLTPSRRPLHLGTIDAALDRLDDTVDLSRRADIAGRHPAAAARRPGFRPQIFPVDVNFADDAARAVVGEPMIPISDRSTDVLENALRRTRTKTGEQLPVDLPRLRRLQTPEVRRVFDQVNEGAEGVLYDNAAEDVGALSMSIIDPTKSKVSVGDPLDAIELFAQRRKLDQ